MSVSLRVMWGRPMLWVLLCLLATPLMGCGSASVRAPPTDAALPTVKKSKKEQEKFNDLTPREKKALRKAKAEG